MSPSGASSSGDAVRDVTISNASATNACLACERIGWIERGRSGDDLRIGDPRHQPFFDRRATFVGGRTQLAEQPVEIGAGQTRIFEERGVFPEVRGEALPRRTRDRIRM
jgi:hypothetical protein